MRNSSLPARKHCLRPVVAAAILAALAGPLAQARDCRPAKNPNTQALINKGLVDARGCQICHVSSDPDNNGNRDVYGLAVDQKISGTASCVPNWWGAAFAALDSDGDGFTNGQELQDPTGAWIPGNPAPGNAALVSDPGSPNSTPPATPTPSPSASLSPTPSLTPSPAQTTTPSETPSISPTESVSPTPSPLPPTILSHPKSLTVKAGQSASFSVEASGEGPLFYAWFRDSAELFQFNPQLDLGPVTAANAGVYTCQVMNAGGTTPSNGATLAVLGANEPNGASYVADTVPAQVAAGSSLWVGVTMANTSNLTWSRVQGYTLNAVSDPGGAFAANASIQIESGTVVFAAGGLYQFIGLLQAPATLGPASMQLRMNDPATGLFGGTATINFTVVPPPNAAEEWARYD